MGKELNKPVCLRPGDTIGIAAPASPFNMESFNEGIKIIEALGFNVNTPENVFRKDGYLAGSDTERAKSLMQLFEDDTVSAIFCARGGFGSMKLLPLLDFGAIADNPKIFLGFSDITALSLAIYQQCGMATFHGPLVTTLGKGSEATIAALKTAISSNTPLILTPSKPLVLHPGKASGPVIGGNLTVLTHLLGTPYEPSFQGHILFLEDRGEAPYRIDRILSQFRLAGHLDGVTGLMLGTFHDCGNPEEIYNIVAEAFQSSQIPILAGFDLGHGPENLTIPVGLRAKLDTENGNLQFEEPAVKEKTP